MSAADSHIIRRQIIELNLPDEKQAFEMQKKASHLYQTEVLPKLDKLLTDLSPNVSDWAVIEKLEIDLGNLPMSAWEAVFTERCLAAFHKILPDLLKEEQPTNGLPKTDSHTENGVATISKERHLLRAFLFFLKNGWTESPYLWLGQSRRDIEKSILEALDTEGYRFQISDFGFQISGAEPIGLRGIFDFKFQISNFRQVRERLVYQFSSRFVLAVLAKIFQRKEIETWLSLFEKLSEIEKEGVVSNLVLKMATLKEGSEIIDFPSVTPPQYKEQKTDVAATEKVKTDSSPEVEKDTTDSLAFFVENGGLILLHPFLPTLFEATGLIEKGKFLSEDKRHTAVQLLQYIVDGHEDNVESSLMLNKWLCGMPFDTPLRRPNLTDEMRAEVETLLQTVIQYWTALKSTSPDGLRETFLKRKAKLSQLNTAEAETEHWQLQIERKGLDILLDYLPWGIGTIRLSWLGDKLLFVNW